MASLPQMGQVGTRQHCPGASMYSMRAYNDKDVLVTDTQQRITEIRARVESPVSERAVLESDLQFLLGLVEELTERIEDMRDSAIELAEARDRRS